MILCAPMAVLRSLLLRASESPWLASRFPTWPVARRAVRKFMPGETLEEALNAVAALARQGLGAVVTELGENVTTIEQAERVARGYCAAMDEIRRRGLDAEPSVKLTHLGLELRQDVCEALVRDLAAHAAGKGSFLWIDMEGSLYTGATLDIYRRIRSRVPTVGVALQSYLRRTPADLETLLEVDAAVRLVKGAYREPPAVAWTTKRDVDAWYERLAMRLLEARAERQGVRVVCGTHDVELLARIASTADRLGLSRNAWEVHMLYGIRAAEQKRLAAAGHQVKVLISYGSAWFAWYMRRLAERPSNLWFVARNIVG